MQARIYKRPKNAMQSGKALTDQWILDFVPAEAKKADPLMGWAGSGSPGSFPQHCCHDIGGPKP